MYKRNKRESPKRRREDLVSHMILQEGDISDTDLSITWVEIAPRASQQLHSHKPEQVYVIITGEGQMRVGSEEELVEKGDLIQIPPNTPHSIENTSDRQLTYVSASTPAYDFTSIYDSGELAENDECEG